MSDEALGVRHERALGALTGLRAGEVLGAVTEGLPRVKAVVSLDSAFPDFGATTPSYASVVEAVAPGERPTRVRPADPAAPPEWVAVAVAAGLEVRADPLDDLVEGVGARLAAQQRDRLTYAGAAAVAAALSAALDEAPWSQCLSLAISAADLAEEAAVYRPGAGVGARLAWAHALGTRAEDSLEIIELLVGVSEAPQEAVPAAFAVVGARDAADPGQPMTTARSAAMLGGRARLIAPVAGALAGALAGVGVFPAHVRDDIDLTRVLARRDGG